VPLVKPALRSELAVLAKKDQPDHLAITVPTVTTVTQARTEAKANPAKTLARKRNCCRFHRNANAKLIQAHAVHPAPREAMALQAREAKQAAMAFPDLKDHPAQPDHLARTANKALVAPRETTARSTPDPKAHLAHLARTERRVNLVHLVNLDHLARMAALAQLLHLANLAALAVPAKMAAKVHEENQANLALQEAANTAHQPVWLQDTKRRRTQSPSIDMFDFLFTFSSFLLSPARFFKTKL